MATGGSGQDINICAICLGDYRDPRFLPCFHTFCASCVQDLADHHTGGWFPCPACRKITSLSLKGVAALQKNYYIQQKPSHQSMCQIHDDEKLRFYCVPCDQVICIDCKSTSHKGHTTQDMKAAISQNQSHQRRLQRAVSDVTTALTSLQTERLDLEKKRAALEKNIHSRHSFMVAAADKKRDEALKSLQSVHKDLDGGILGDIEQQEGHKAELSSLLQQLDNALTAGNATDVFPVAKEMRSGRGSLTAIDKMTSPVAKPFQRPILVSDVSTDMVTQAIDNYLGKVRQVEMKERVHEAKVTECFQCAQDPDVQVFSLCHEDRDPPRVLVSYEQRGMKKNAPVKGFRETGKCVYTSDNVGKVSYIRHAEGKVMCPAPQSGRFRTFCKSPTAALFSLDNNLSGQADIERTTVISTDPFETELKAKFTIQVGPHRAFDVDNTERYFAVVEEARKSTSRRSVHLYRRTMKKAVSTYTPPTEECRPSDVCFYTLSGENVLLVTDEGTDSIHVVKISGHAMHFAGYLSAGCPSLVQPTAITVDVHERLWVACRGGSVLMIERID